MAKTTLTKSQLTQLIKEEVVRMQRTKTLKEEKMKIEKELKSLSEDMGEDEGMQSSEMEPPISEGFTKEQIFSPGAIQPMAESVDPGIADAVTMAINWLTSSSDSMHGSMPNATLLAGPALMALSAAVVKAQMILKTRNAGKGQAPAPAQPPVQK